MTTATDDSIASQIYNDGIDAAAWGDNEMDDQPDSQPDSQPDNTEAEPVFSFTEPTDVNLDHIVSVQLSTTKFSATKGLSDEEKQRVAGEFLGKSKGFSGSKRIIPPDDPTLKKINSVFSRTRSLWEAYSQPYPFIDGVRLTSDENMVKIREAVQAAQSRIQSLEHEMTSRRQEIMDSARELLGDAFDPTLYPPSFCGRWTIELGHPSIKPDDRLKKIDPALYEREVQKVMDQVRSSADIYLDQMIAAFDQMATEMLERLTPGDDGKLKRFTKTSFDRWRETFEAFESVSAVMSGERKDKVQAVVNAAKSALDGVTAEGLKKNKLALADFRSKFTSVKAQLGGMIETVERQIDLED